ncbi:MAG: type II toxin-antitoxin system PemK/MazF family toxin [Melioribacteraceae bacterium]
MKLKSYIPERGDIVWLCFNPQAGHEQSGKTASVVTLPKEYNQKTNLAIFCPITNQVKGYPFEVKIPDNLGISGAILSDQIKSLDWNVRKAEFICSLPDDALKETLNKINALIGAEI